MSTLRLQLNPGLDVAAYAKGYAQAGIVRLANVLTPESAESVARVLEQETPWRVHLSHLADGKRQSDAAYADGSDQDQLETRAAVVLERARAGFAFQYLYYPMIQAYFGGQDSGHPIHQVSEFLNSPPFLQLLRDVTGRQDIVKAMAQATNFRPGDFLAWHDDSSDDADTRAVAYTLSFTRGWRPDWGGQLLFHDPNGQVLAGLAPVFNGLTLFSVPRAHSVATVAAYAGAPRISIVGWGRTDPPHRTA
jgi:SM-20-related protein